MTKFKWNVMISDPFSTISNMLVVHYHVLTATLSEVLIMWFGIYQHWELLNSQ